MRVRSLALLLSAVIAAGCTRASAPALEEYRDAAHGFVIRHPAGWSKVGESAGTAVRFVPPGATAASPEFIVIYTMREDHRLTDPEIRTRVFMLLTIHGVSGFQQDARTTADVLWYKFEVTGATEGLEWASVGVVTAGSRGFHVSVCAKPLDKWREGQKQCDDVMKSFRPGKLQ